MTNAVLPGSAWPVILGVDPSFHGLGWAVGCSQWDKPQWGTISAPTERADCEGEYFCKVRDTLTPIIQRLGVMHIAIEEPIHAPTDTNPQRELAMVGTVATLLALAHDFQIEASYVSIAEWRKRFINRSNAPKEYRAKGKMVARRWLKDRVERECKRRGWNVRNDNEADACGVMHLALSVHDHDYARADAPIFRR